MKLFGIGLIAAMMAGPVLAGGLRQNDDDWERRVIQRAERAHMHEVGGYNDPITAFRNLFAGELTERDIAPGVNTLHAVPRDIYLGADRLEGDAASE